ncbi:MAG: CerR family C-terminal domain-containing protein [Syntrophorhabdales bacterium]|jgi:AcrR family transcriptional regulator
MKVPRQDAARTRESLLAAASDIFADKGYRDATIAEISIRAGANVAAINYHFGDKETLYREAWRDSFRESVKAHPPDGGVDAGARPGQRLRGYVAALLARITDKNNKEFLIVHKELANPTGLLEEVIQEEIQPIHQRMENLVLDIIGPRASDMQVRFCTIGIISQCFIPVVINRMEAKERDARNDPWKIEDIEAYAEHVVKFSLAGLRAVRHGAKKGVGGHSRKRGGHAD